MAKKDKGFDLAKVMKPIDLTPIIVAVVVGLGSSVGAGVVGDAARNKDKTDCSVAIGRAIDEHKAAPTIKVRYTGPEEDQCKINSVIDKLQ